MRLFHYYIIGILVFLSGCNENSLEDVYEETHIEQDEFLDGYYEWNYEDTNVLWVSAEYKNNVLNGSKKVFYRNGNLKEHHHYEDGYLKGISQFYYQDGKLETEKEIIKFYEDDTAFVNTNKRYDSHGDIIDDSSFYYVFLNDKRQYSLNEEFYLNVKLNRSHFDDKQNVVAGDFDEFFNLLGNKVRYLPIEDGFIPVSVPTNEVGRQEYKFIINDYTYVNLTDSLMEYYQILVEYEYEVLD